jgi:hypothetical protein
MDNENITFTEAKESKVVPAVDDTSNMIVNFMDTKDRKSYLTTGPPPIESPHCR